MKKISWPWIFVAFILGYALCHPKHAHAAGHDTVAIETVAGNNEVFTDCTVVEDWPTYFAVSCDNAQDLGNTVFTGSAIKEESVVVLLPNSFRFYPLVCFLVEVDKYKNGNVYKIECLQGSG